MVRTNLTPFSAIRKLWLAALLSRDACVRAFARVDPAQTRAEGMTRISAQTPGKRDCTSNQRMAALAMQDCMPPCAQGDQVPFPGKLGIYGAGTTACA
jgi:hypothetical protein